MRVSRIKVLILLSQLLLFALLNAVYTEVIVKEYEDLGFEHHHRIFPFVGGWLLVIASCIIIFLFSKTDFVFSILNLVASFFLFPNVILHQYMDTDLIICTGIFSLIVFTICLQKIIKPVKIAVVISNRKGSYILLTAFILLIPFVLVYGLPKTLVIDLDSVYDLRAENSIKGNLLTNYTYSLLSYWLLPSLIILGFIKRVHLFMIVGTMGLLYLFLVTGNKITLFVLLPTCGFLIFKSYREKLLAFYCGVLLLYATGFILFTRFDNNTIITDLLIRRFLFIPALLNQQYIEYFQGMPVYYAHSFLSAFIDYPHDALPSRLIGFEYQNGANATNGIVSDGFLNLGKVGVIVNSFLAAIIICYFNRLNFHASFLGIGFLLVQCFIDVPMFTLLLTHGLFLYTIIATTFLKDSTSELEN